MAQPSKVGSMHDVNNYLLASIGGQASIIAATHTIEAVENIHVSELTIK